MKNLIFLGIMVFPALNFVLFFNRTSTWIKSRYKWYLVSVLFLIGSILLTVYKSKDFDTNVLFIGFMTPAIFTLIDVLIAKWSFIIHQRDFYLWLRGSSDLDNRKGEFKASDRIFSILLLYTILTLFILPVIILKRIN